MPTNQEIGDRLADAYEELSDAVTSAVMRAERQGLSEQDIINVILGDLSIRPGYPAAGMNFRATD